MTTAREQKVQQSWRSGYGEVVAGAVRGGILGQSYDDRPKAFDRLQASAVGMKQIP